MGSKYKLKSGEEIIMLSVNVNTEVNYNDLIDCMECIYTGKEYIIYTSGNGNKVN